MAIYHATTKHVKRGAGQSAVAAAAYRARGVVHDERIGVKNDYRHLEGHLFDEILTPDGQTVSRAELWNAAEAAEKRKDARTAREWQIALPHELDAAERKTLARDIARDIVRRYGVACDMNLHAPDRAGDERNFHAHLLFTTRQVHFDEQGRLAMGEKSVIELSDKKRKQQGLQSGAEEIKDLRAMIAEKANAALERGGHKERVDERSFQERGEERQPTKHLGPHAARQERKGEKTRIGDENRAAQNFNKLVEQRKVINLEIEREKARLNAQALRRAEDQKRRAAASAKRSAMQAFRAQQDAYKAAAGRKERLGREDKTERAEYWDRDKAARESDERIINAAIEQEKRRQAEAAQQAKQAEAARQAEQRAEAQARTEADKRRRELDERRELEQRQDRERHAFEERLKGFYQEQKKTDQLREIEERKKRGGIWYRTSGQEGRDSAKADHLRDSLEQGEARKREQVEAMKRRHEREGERLADKQRGAAPETFEQFMARTEREARHEQKPANENRDRTPGQGKAREPPGWNRGPTRGR